MMTKNDPSLTTPAQSLTQRPSSTKADWLVPAGLIALSFIPVVAGSIRIGGLSGGGAITPENARFFADPLPVVIHIIGATLFCILGAFQFSAGFRRRRPGWHRYVGRILILCGLAAGFSGLWMTHVYPLYPQLQGSILYGFRIFFGIFMIMSILLSFVAIRQRNLVSHRAWIIRGYAIGQGAGTQALVGLPWFLLFGKPSELTNALMMGLCWIINLVIAEWLIRRKAAGTRQHQPVPALQRRMG